MSYTWLKFGQINSPGALSNTALGVKWIGHMYMFRMPTNRSFSQMDVGATVGGGAWLYRRGASSNDLPSIVMVGSSMTSTSPRTIRLASLATTTQMNDLGIPVGSAYRLEWRIRKENEITLYYEAFVNGIQTHSFFHPITAAYSSDYIQIRAGNDNNTASAYLWYREMYECEDDPILGYWEFRTVPVTALPNQKLTTSQVRNGWTSDEGFSQLVTIDKSAIPEDNTVLAYITDHQLYAKKRSPRQSEQSFSTELHGAKSPIRTVNLLPANTNPTEHSNRYYVATELGQPTLARDLDPTLRFDYQFTIEE